MAQDFSETSLNVRIVVCRAELKNEQGPSRRNCDSLLSIYRERDRSCTGIPSKKNPPQFMSGARIQCKHGSSRGSENHASARREQTAIIESAVHLWVGALPFFGSGGSIERHDNRNRSFDIDGRTAVDRCIGDAIG